MSKRNNQFTWNESVTLKEFLTAKIDALEKATVLAKQNMELRLEGMNEWRAQSKDRETNFVSKQEVAQLTKFVYIGIGILLALQFLLKFFI